MADLPAHLRSFWLTGTGPALTNVTATVPGEELDVAVLGAGIAGLTTAYLLAGRGLRVAVLEARHPGAGTTGHTTAKVTAQHGLSYQRLAGRFGPETARAYGQSQLAALDWLTETVRSTGIDCDWEPRDSYVYAPEAGAVERVRTEADICARLGLPADFHTGDIGLPYPVAGAVRFTGGAQFHPGKWLAGLAGAVTGRGGAVCSGVRATGLREGTPCRVRTTAGVVRARHVVVATHYPIFDRGGFFARLSLLRDLVIAGPAPAGVAVPPAMYLAADGSRSVRTAPLAAPGNGQRPAGAAPGGAAPGAAPPGGERLVIVSGEHYRTGTTSEVRARYARLADWARQELGLGELTYAWSAHDMSTVDGLPYVGRYHPRAEHLWVATGFGAWGMTNGTLAGLVLADLVTGERNAWAPLYDPVRFTAPAALGLLKDNATVAKLLVGGYAGAVGGPAGAQLRPGQGTVVWRGVHPTAVCRTADGTRHAVSARCTHLGCLVRWNDAEESWDCPCHGSRFTPDGEVLQGPAVRPLPPSGASAPVSGAPGAR